MKNLISSLFILFCMNTLFSCSNDAKPVMRFGLIADIQYCDCETYGSRFYANSLQKLEECIDDLNNENVSFTVNLGDMVDRDTEGNIEAVLSRLNKANKNVYNTTGNHDYGGITDNDALYKKLGMPSAYYSFTQKGWRFILLNTNEVASYANIDGTFKEAELQQMRQRIKETGSRNGATYNGGISSVQMKWLNDELALAAKKKENVIILSHHPLYAAKGLTALNDLEIVELITSYPEVKLVISGHHHPGDFGTYKDIPFITTEGMIETADTNAYGIVEIYKDTIKVIGKGRTKSYDLPIK
ncbi:metallophosphoesterase [Parabacteroides sp. OttesenSCG-928-G06]|nr:metallophosphoesterase [Parabacteroides sp. OttesenSCG-928-G06]